MATIAERNADLDRMANPFDFGAGLGEVLRAIAAEEMSNNMDAKCDLRFVAATG